MGTSTRLQAVLRCIVAGTISACVVVGGSPVAASAVAARDASTGPIPGTGSSVLTSGWDGIGRDSVGSPVHQFEWSTLASRPAPGPIPRLASRPVPRLTPGPIPRLTAPLLRLWLSTAHVVRGSLTLRADVNWPVSRMWFKK